jgi:tetrahydromethanopterin S-methyltransferase subunit C
MAAYNKKGILKLGWKKRLNEFLTAKDGIDRIFKSLSQITASSAVMALVPYIADRSIFSAIVTFFLASLILALAFISGVSKFWIPFLKCVYGPNEKFSEIEALGLRSCFTFQYLIYTLSAFLFFFLVNIWVESILLAAIK